MMMINNNKIISYVDKVILDYQGNANELEKAIGVWIVGRKMGWKVLFLIHDRKTLIKYEEILGIQFRTELNEVGTLAKKSLAWKKVQKVTNFWKAVRGGITGIRSPNLS